MPELTDTQRKEISEWVAQGDNLSVIQKKLQEQFQVQMTYMDVRFLVDDLQLELKDPVRAPDPALQDEAPMSPPPPLEQETAGSPEGEEGIPLPSSVSVEVDPVSLNPAAIASGSVRFSDGVTAKWMVDQQGRPGLTDVSQAGYRPSQTDAEAFMTQLATALHEKGF